MKKVLALLVLALATVLLVSACGGTTSGAVQVVDPTTFLEKTSQPGITVIDVRTPEEYAAGHVDGAINIDVEGPGFDQRIAELDPTATYAVYCRSGRRSALAADAMEKAGFTAIINLSGGIGDLQAAGAPLAAS